MSSASIFPETADIETSSDDYARRFAGETGAWLLSVQERISMQFLQNESVGNILDVGGGHGQLTEPLLKAGWDVTVLGSDESCKNRILPFLQKPNCRFQVGNLVQLPYPAESFDHVVCYRFVSHCGAWQQLLRELCRVSRKSVIIDYPPLLSWNFLTPLLFQLKKKLEGNTRTYTLFKHQEVEGIFKEKGFQQIQRRGQFFLPMVVHRKLKSPERSEQAENFFRSLGLNDFFGSPTILQAKKGQ